MQTQAKTITLASRPEGLPEPANFNVECAPLPAPGDGELLVRVHYMSLDPYMRGMMADLESYADPVAIGGMMPAIGVGEILESRSADYLPSEFVTGMFGWTTHARVPADQVAHVDADTAPLSAYLGVLGMPGLTAWFGLREHARPKAGETLVVGAATGAVGSMVGQLAKRAGLRVIGVAGGADKCREATETFGFDACIDHRAYDTPAAMRAALADVCPDGVDIYFENLGGLTFEAILPLMNAFGRIPVCGMVAWMADSNYGERTQELTLPEFWRNVNAKFLDVTGFVIANHLDSYPDFLAEVAPLVADGSIKYAEDIAEDIENAPAAFRSMLTGGNRGKQVVKLV